jgi:hypothetical protein
MVMAEIDRSQEIPETEISKPCSREVPMKHFNRGVTGIVVVAMLILTIGINAQAADDNRAAPTGTVWTNIYGTDTQTQTAFGVKVSSLTSLVLGGQTQNTALLLHYNQSTDTETATTNAISGGTFAGYGFTAATSNDYLIAGSRVLSGTESRASIMVQDWDGSTHSLVWEREEGAVGDLEEYHKIVQFSGGTYSGQFVGVGSSDATDASIDMLFDRYSATGTTPLSSVEVGQAALRELARDAVVDGSGNIYVVGLQGASGSQDFILTKVDESFAEATNYPIDLKSDADISSDGNDDELLGAALTSDGNTLYVVGNTDDGLGTPSGFLAAVDVSGATPDPTWEYTKANVTFKDVAILASGDLVVTGQSGDAIWLAEVNSSGSEDWTTTYTESGRTGAIGNAVEEVSTGEIIVVGDVDGATSGTDILMVAFSEPTLQLSASKGTGNDVVRIDARIEVGSYTYYDGQNYLVLDTDTGESAADAYDSNDVPEMPAPAGGSYIRAYWNEADATPTALTENWVDPTDDTGEDVTAVASQYTFTIEVPDALDQETCELLFATNQATANVAMLLWDDINSEWVDLNSTTSFSFTIGDGVSNGVDSKDFYVLVGDNTAPTFTINYPAADDEMGKWTAIGTSNTIDLSFDDDTLPVTSVIVEYSDDDGVSYDTISVSPVTVTPAAGFSVLGDRTLDDGDIDFNTTKTQIWIPGNDTADEALISLTSGVSDKKLRISVVDVAGNATTTETSSFKMVGDRFDFSGTVNGEDYSTNFFTVGWHFVSVPLEPGLDASADLPSAVWTAYDDNTTTADSTDDTEGILGNFDVKVNDPDFGDIPASDIDNFVGYWMYLDTDNIYEAGDPNHIGGLGRVSGTGVHKGETVDVTLKAESWNNVGVPILVSGSDVINPEDFLFSNDGGSTWSTHADAVTSGWIQADNFNYYNHSGSAYASILDTDDMTLGRGYTFPVLATTDLTMRAVYDSVIVAPAPSFRDGDVNRLLEWKVPVSFYVADLVNENVAFGTHPDAANLYDSQYDLFAPTSYPADYIFAGFRADDLGYVGPMGNWFRTDMRAPIEEGTTEARWDLYVSSSKTGQMTVVFDATELQEFAVPAGFTAKAIVGELEFDLVENQELTFDYTNAGEMTHIEVILSYSPSSVGENGNLPTRYEIESAYPNPFNPSTSVRVALPEAANLEVVVFNIMGQRVATLANGRFNAGYHTLVFDAADLASGIYFVRANVAGKMNVVKKVLLQR